MSNDVIRIAVIALVAVIVAKLVLPRIPGGQKVLAYL